jgi:hypothetical protein
MRENQSGEALAYQKRRGLRLLSAMNSRLSGGWHDTTQEIYVEADIRKNDPEYGSSQPRPLRVSGWGNDYRYARIETLPWTETAPQAEAVTSLL